ncbi:MAG: deacylase [Flavobacteriaceae bacterium]|nr:acyloxyacyl hydrolase [Bacteroidia bacterium]NNL60043.1 deacylase [Flavobacteriaceae bacterium]
MLQNCIIAVLLISSWNVFSQSRNGYFLTPEILVGKTMEANTGFPDSGLQTGFYLNFSRKHDSDEELWARELKYPQTGLSLGFSDFGNSDLIGKAFTIMPTIQMDLLKTKKDKTLSILMGMGMSYMDTQYDILDNPFNKGISTKLNWSFKSFFYYDAFKLFKTQSRIGLGYLHHSNGHIRLPNQGLNSFLLSVSSQFQLKDQLRSVRHMTKDTTRLTQTYFSLRTGIGQNVLSQAFNDKKEVYSLAAAYGKIINGTFKFGGGLYYRFYEKYYDHIKNRGDQVEEQVPEYIDHPFRYATNFGAFGTAEILMNHVGIEFNLGINFYKPFYKIDWQLSQGYTWIRMVDGEPQIAYVLEELNDYYKLKRTVSSRLGIKYYILNTNDHPRHNVFFGAHINANLGQADFSEFSLGYVRRFNLKKKTVID